MPEISRFHGIGIHMYWDDHGRPHFHAIHGEHEAKIEIGTGLVLDGHLPRRLLRLVRKWELMHRDELHTNWRRAREGKAPLRPVDPLP